MSEKGKKLDEHEKTVLKILDNHKGKKCAISGAKLAKFSGVCERRVRDIITHLIFTHGIRIVSSSKKKESGYYFPQNKQERQEFFRVFRRRGITSLAKAAQVEETTLLEISISIVLERCKEGEKVPGTSGALNYLLKHFYGNQKLYFDEIKALEALRSEAPPLLVDQRQMEEIKVAAKEANEANCRLQELTGSVLEAKT